MNQAKAAILVPCPSNRVTATQRQPRIYMPLPQEPTRPLTNSKSARADKELLLKAIFCVLIGLGVVVSPYYVQSPGMQGIVAQAAWVGWFALALGVGLGLTYARRVARPRH
jgi:hypothetical protein